jgi:hypothetical protein
MEDLLRGKEDLSREGGFVEERFALSMIASPARANSESTTRNFLFPHIGPRFGTSRGA